MTTRIAIIFPAASGRAVGLFAFASGEIWLIAPVLQLAAEAQSQWMERARSRNCGRCLRVAGTLLMVGDRNFDAALRSIAGLAPRMLINDYQDLRERRCSISDVGVNTLARDARSGTLSRKDRDAGNRDS